MANGTTVAASIYYSDTTTYTGVAGSETNPYCIEDLYDLINNPRINTKPNTEDLYYYYIVVNDIDMNDSREKYIYSPPLGISLYFKKIDFKNHELRNITIYNNNSNYYYIFNVVGHSTSTSIHNLKLTNFISYNSTVTIFSMNNNDKSDYRFYFYNCDFSIYADTTFADTGLSTSIIELILRSASYVYFHNCVFNIKANLGFHPIKGTIIDNNYLCMNYCHIHLYIIKNLYILIDDIGLFNSSYITGDIYGSVCSEQSLITTNGTVMSKLTNSYVNVNFHNTNPENPTPIYGYTHDDAYASGAKCGSASFINKSKLEGFTACPATIPNYYELTDEECKDASKLQEIGFLAV